MAIISGGGGGGGLLLSATYSLTAAQIKASTLTPTTVLAAPGANKLTVPISYVFVLTFAGVAYTDPSVAVQLGNADLGAVFGGLSATQSVVEWAQGVPELQARSDVVNGAVKLQARLRGSIVTSSIGNGGVGGYAVNDTGTVNDGSPLAAYKILSVDAFGVVITYSLTSAGDGYVPNVEEATTVGGAQPGVGTGFTIIVNSVDASGQVGDGTLAGALYYVIADV